MAALTREVRTLSELQDYPLTETLRVCLSSEQLGVTEAETVAGWLGERRVEYLDFSRTGLTDKSLIPLLTAIKQNSHIQIVDLSSNQIGDTGAIAIAETITLRKRITWHVTCNNIRASGAEALVRALANARHNYSIDLSENGLGNEGALKVALALKDIRGNIRHLYLRYNGIDDEGDRLLAKNLPQAVEVTYRTEAIRLSEYAIRHPWVYLLALFFLPIAIFFIMFEPFLPLLNDGVTGLKHRRTI